MSFNSYLNLGFAYDCEGNFYNALMAYVGAIYYEDANIKGRNGRGMIYSELGLQVLGLQEIQRCIYSLEKQQPINKIESAKYYSNRAGFFRMLDKNEEMILDLKKADLLCRNFANVWIEESIFHINNCNFGIAVDCLNKAIKYDESIVYSWRNRAKLFILLGDYERALYDIQKAYDLSRIKKNTLYELGFCYYLNGEMQKAEYLYKEYVSKFGWKETYDESLFQVGIIQNINHNNGQGHVLGSSWFNDFDSICFNVSDSKGILSNGQRVRFKIKYIEENNHYIPKATDLEPYKYFRVGNQNAPQIFHAIINSNKHTFKSIPGFTYVMLFYPEKTLLEYSLIESALDENLRKELSLFGYSFIEIELKFDKNFMPSLVSIKSLSQPNQYSNKSVFRRSKTILNDFPSGRKCRICGNNFWCGSDGCPLDPTL